MQVFNCGSSISALTLGQSMSSQAVSMEFEIYFLHIAEIKASPCWKINYWVFQHLIRYLLYVLPSPVSSCFKVLSWEQFRQENCSAALCSLLLCQGVSGWHSKTKRRTLGKVWILDHSGLILWDTVASIYASDIVGVLLLWWLKWVSKWLNLGLVRAL